MATAAEAARSQGFELVVATDSPSGVAKAHDIGPATILVDLQVPPLDGVTVTDHLKSSPDTRHIPITALSALDQRTEARKAGAARFINKPVGSKDLEAALAASRKLAGRHAGRLLLVGEESAARTSVAELLGGPSDVEVATAESEETALERLEEGGFDCIVLSVGVDPAGIDGVGLLDKLEQDGRFAALPVVIYTAGEPTPETTSELEKREEGLIMRTATSLEALIEATSLYLHQSTSELPDKQLTILEGRLKADSMLHGKKVLIVDDDVRNLFALASMLEARGIEVLFAENGRDGIATLKGNPAIDLVLMDIMMPGMNGYEAMGAIRSLPQFAELPLIALTAKAMQGDREDSLTAGASDYITKPVDTDELLSLMKAWLCRSAA